MLTNNQELALKVLAEISEPCGLNTILSKSSGAFGSKALLKQSLTQLVTLGKVKLQSNGYYKIEKLQTVKPKATKVKAKVKPVAQKEKPNKENEVIGLDIVSKSDTHQIPIIDKSESNHSVLMSIDELAAKLNKPAVQIVDCDLKGQALAKLADLMSDDIAELLLDIKSDLERAAA